MRLLVSLIAGLLISQATYAKIIRVNNISGTPDGPVYNTLSAAIEAADANGEDTLYLEPSPTLYSSSYLDITKQLTFIGNGYFLRDNPNTPLNKRTSRIGNLHFKPGSEGSRVIGCDDLKVRLDVSNLTFERNRITELTFWANASFQNIVVTQNYITYVSRNYEPILKNSIFSNNYFTSHINLGSRILSAVFENNIFHNVTSNFYTVNTNFENNIFVGNPHVNVFQLSNLILNNIFTEATYRTDAREFDGNLFGIPATTLFTQGNASPDGRWQLNSDAANPAKNFPVDGSEAGMFYGHKPYVLSGLPPIPIITRMQATKQVFSEDGMTVKVTINNQQ